jgi:hypothetical protein
MTVTQVWLSVILNFDSNSVESELIELRTNE